MRRLRVGQDAFGHEIRAAFAGEHPMEIIERDDGLLDVYSAAYLLAPYAKWPSSERKAMRYVRGRVLDVGAGGGRVSVHLQALGHDVVAIDNSPLAIDVMRRRGVRDARVLAFEAVDARLGAFDTIVMLGNNFGLFGTPARARRMLRRMRATTIVAQTVDPYTTTDPLHLAYHARNRRRGRLSGQLRIRVRFRAIATPWFDYLFVSPDELRAIVDGTGWEIRKLIRGAGAPYTVVLTRDGVMARVHRTRDSDPRRSRRSR